MALSTDTPRTKTLHYLGPEGSYHSVVARALADQYVLKPERDFESIYASLRENHEGLVAIENSHTGDIQPNFSKVMGGEYRILGEYELPINHVLMTHHTKTLYEVKKIYVHPQIILQCSEFLHSLPDHEKVSVNASSEGATRISKGDTDSATIGSKELATKYGLEVRQENIGNVKNNITRFYHITKSDQQRTEFKTGDKVAMTFTLPHSSGALSHVLSYFTLQQANLTKLESIPLHNKVWEYQFFVEMIIDIPFSTDNFKHLISHLTILGVY
jgi:prephenate dehydratase